MNAFERKNAKKYQYVYRYENADYKLFFHAIGDIIEYLNTFDSIGYK